MCSEFILALIYFTVIFTVNFFLSKLLKTYFNNILYLLKIKNIFNLYKPNEILTISFLYSLIKKNLVNLNSLIVLEKIIQKEETFNKNWSKKLKNGRNSIAGLVNSKNINPELANDTDLVIYEIIDPFYPVDKQFDIINNIGFKTNFIIRN
jgi:hypothetical protein